MPTYAYRRDDGPTFEKQQRITEDPLEECPETGQPVERIITGSPGIIMESGPNRGEPDDVTTPAPTCSGPVCGL